MPPLLRHFFFSLISAWLALASLPAMAAHRDAAPLPRDVVQRIVSKSAVSSSSPLVDAVNQFLDGLTQIASPQQAGPSQGLLVAGQRTALAQLRLQAETEFAQTRAHLLSQGLSDQVSAWDAFVVQIESRFDSLDAAMAAANVPDPTASAGALDNLRAKLSALHGAVPAREFAPTGVPSPTFRLDVPPFPAPVVPSKAVPRYMTRQALGNMYAFVGKELLAAAPPTPPEAMSCGYTSADLSATPDTPQTAEIQTLAQQLGYSPARIFQYVSNNIRFEPYYGSLKGAQGTYYAQAGGPTDQASLLIALLRASNIPARYVRGQVAVIDPVSDPGGGRIARWLGAKSYTGAANILAQGRFSAAYYPSSGQTTGVSFNHVWVEACVPYGHYRGVPVDNTGERWIPLDPSFKDKTYQAGIAIGVSFDYGSYLAARKNGPGSLPQEAYALQVEAAVRSTNPNATAEDVPYAGTIKALTVDLLPASLPFEVLNFTNWFGTSSPEAALLPANHRYRFAISGLGLASPYSLYLPDVALSRVTLGFKGATSGDQTALNSWYAGSGDPTCGLHINVVPVLRVEGVDKSIAGSSVNLCTTTNTLTLGVYLDEVDPNNPLGHAVTYTNIAAANWHALQAYAFQASDALLAKRAASLISAVNTTPNPNASDTTRDSIEGEFLHLVSLKYMRYATDALKGLGGLNGESGESGNHLGLASSQSRVQYLFDLPYAVNRNGFLVDMPGMLSRSVDLTTGSSGFANFKLGAYATSAYESYVWQENAQLDAVSTVRGLQFANETGIGIVTATSANWSTVRSQLSVFAGQSPDDCNNNGGLQYPRCLIDSTTTGVLGLINQGYTVTLPRSLIQYGNWKGYVHADESSAVIGMIISKWAGGFTTDPLPADTNTYNTGNTASNYILQTDAPAVLSTDPALVNSGNGANGQCFGVCAGDPVNMVTGNMYHNERDIVVKGRGGLPIVFDRAYNSRKPVDGPLGFGWTHSFNHVLKMYGVESGKAKLSWIDGKGAEKFFATTSQTNGHITKPSTVPDPSGIFVNFQRLSNGTYTIQEKNGLLYTFANVNGPSGVPGPNTTPTYAQLLSIADRKGNVLTMSYTAISGCTGGALLCAVTDGLGRTVLTFSYSGTRISQIQDLSGRQFQYTYDANGNLITFKNPLTITGTQSPVTYTYYAASDGASLNHLMKQYTLPRGNGMKFDYYENGRTFRHTVVLTNGTLSPDQVNTFTYNDFRRETVQVNERGYERHFFFDPYGNPLKITEENGADHTYTYDCPDPTKSIGDRNCRNPFNRLSKTDPTGYATQYAYDSNGNVTQITTPRGATVKFFDFTAFNQPRRIQDGNGHWTILRYDGVGNLTDEIHTIASYTPPVCSGECTIPAANQILSWTVNGYDSVGNLTSAKRVRDFAGQIANNTPTSNTGPILTYTFDTNKLNVTTMSRTGIKNSDVGVTTQASATFTYDSLNRLTSGVDADWQPTQFAYDALDRVTQATDRLGKLRTYQFDANGNPTGQQLKLPVAGVNTLVDSSAARYDDSDRKIATIDAGGFVTAYAYDPAGNVLSIANPDNYVLSFDYDPANRAVHAYDQENHAVTTTRDTDGRTRTVTDPNGNVVTNAYWDASRDGRLKSTTYPKITNNGSGPTLTGGRAVQFDYDVVGNVISVAEIPAAGSGQANRTTTTSYDELNRPTRIVGPQYTDAMYGAVCPVTIDAYDTLGRLTQVSAGRTPTPCTNAASDIVTPQLTYAFDDFGRKVKQTDALGQFWSYSYDGNNNLLTSTDAKGQTTSFTWDVGHQLLTRTEQGGRLTTYIRNGLGQPTQAQHPEATYSYGYDTAHRLAQVSDSRGGKTLSYAWSPGGLLNTVTDTEGRRTDYLYDPVGRLAEAIGPNDDSLVFRFDAGGRLAEKLLPNGGSARYLYNEDNTLHQVVNRNTASTILTQHDYAYDGVGNRLSHAEQIGGTTLNYAYSYDELKRLTQVANGTASQQESYAYDPLGNRTVKSIGNPASTTYAYLYDNANQLKEIHSGSLGGPLLATLNYDANGNLTSDGTRTYTWDPINQLSQVTRGATSVAYSYDSQGRRVKKVTGGQTTQWLYDGQNIYAEYGTAWTNPNAIYTQAGIDTPLIRTTLSGGNFAQAQYYHSDGLGSIVGLSNNTDSTTQTERFDAWGTTLSGTIPQSAQYGYTGREPDETGLIYYRARYTEPTIGRFIARDPIGVAGGINVYAYVGNNPIALIDPLGLLPTDPIVVAQLAVPGVATDAASGLVGGAAGSPGYQGLNSSGTQVTPGYQLVDGQLQPIPPSTRQTFTDFITDTAGGISSGAQRIWDLIIDVSNSGFQTIADIANNVTLSSGSNQNSSPGSSPLDILAPGGQPIGNPGTSPGIRELPGGLPAAQDLFGELSRGGTRIDKPGYPGTLVQLPNNGGTVGIRPVSGSGGPAIDINIPGFKGKIHFPH